MEQMALFDVSPRWTVTDITRHLRQLFESDPELQDVWVQGEISNISRPASGHIYFTLKDRESALRCVIWKKDAARLRFAPLDGAEVEAHGRIGIYEVSGQYQLYADSLRPLGEGELYQEFLRLKALLEAEGLFEISRKRPIPEQPHSIGIVTSPTGAALRDILQTLQRRMPLADVFLAPTPVQGDEAPLALVRAIQDLNETAAPDVILVARGGGSIEDLWAFNDERVVRAVARSHSPVISGVGHETDFTLVDFAADLRAATPTAAAELATPVTVLDLLHTLMDMAGAMEANMMALVERQNALLEGYQTKMRYFSPMRLIEVERQHLDELLHRGNTMHSHRLELEGARLQGVENRLTALNPQAVLERGYAVVMKNRLVVSSRTQVQPGDQLQVRVRDGEFDAHVSDNG